MNMNFAWLDLETTGSDVNWHQILEVGCIVTDYALHQFAGPEGMFHAVVAPRWPIASIDRVVLNMHLASGLWADAMESNLDISGVDVMFAKFLDCHTVKGRIALAGSGVCHFDRKFIDRWMPESAKRLTYWPMDVGVVRRFGMMIAGVENPCDVTDDKPHRSLEDVRLHLQEARAWRDLVKGVDA
jgi:oligoribonuclease